MQLDIPAYIRLTASGSLGMSPSGGAFATSTGDVLEVACFGPGLFRLRIGANTLPDYGLVVGRAQRCDITQTEPGVWSFSAGGTRFELTGEPLRFRLLHDEQPLITSITDEHFRGFPRLPVIGRTRTGQQWMASFALASGEPVYGLGEKFGPLNKRGQLVTSHVEDALGVNTELSYKSVPFCWSPGSGASAKGGAWGVFVNTTGRVAHGVGHPAWSHRSYVLVVDDEALDLFLIAGRDPAQVLDRYTTLTGRAPDVPLWSLGLWMSRASYRTADEAMAVAEELRLRKIPGGSSVRLFAGFERHVMGEFVAAVGVVKLIVADPRQDAVLSASRRQPDVRPGDRVVARGLRCAAADPRSRPPVHVDRRDRR